MGILSLVSAAAYVDLAVLFLLVVYFFIISEQKANKYQQALLKQMLFVVLMVAGYAFRQISLSTGTLTIAQKLIFLGGSLSFYYTLQCYSIFCQVDIPKWFNRLLKIWTIALAVIMVSFDFHHLVYTGYENFTDFMWTDTNGFMHLDLSGHSGPFLWIYRINDFAYTVGTLVLTIIAAKRSHSKRLSRQYVLLYSTILISMSFYVLSFVPAIKALGIDFLPIGQGISSTVLMYLVFQTKIYDLNDTVHVEAYESSRAGIISISYENGFQGANPLAEAIFPNLKAISYNEEITEKNLPDVYDFIIGDENEVHFGDKIYELSVTEYPERELRILWFNDVTVQKEYIGLLENYQAELEQEVEEKTEHIREMQDKIMMGMSDIIENRDGSTGGHVKRTSYIVELLSNKMLEDNYPGMTEQFRDWIVRSAPMHDLGKISISDAILQKPGKLDDSEFDIMKSHSARGANMVDQLLEGLEDERVVKMTERIARNHHEKWNGMGYPDRLAGEDIPLEARIMAVADVYDALVSKRCYKDPMPFDVAYGIMDESFGNHFDPSLKKYFDECRDIIEDYYAKNRE